MAKEGRRCGLFVLVHSYLKNIADHYAFVFERGVKGYALPPFRTIFAFRRDISIYSVAIRSPSSLGFPSVPEPFMTRVPRLALLAFASISFFGLPLPVCAMEAASVTRTHERAIQTPSGKFIQNLGDSALKIIADKQLPSDKRAEEFSKILGEDFDLKVIGRFVIGRTWGSATPEQQVEYMDLFKALVIRNYGSRMALYTGEGFQVVSTLPQSEFDTTVRSQITHPDGSKATDIDWLVRQKEGKMGVVDVVVEGVSLSVTQRQEYAAVIQNNGGNIEGLLQVMRDQLKTRTATSEMK
jgi:phospholipid transport system substrate-binding protein